MIDEALLNCGQEKDMSGDGCGGRVQECWEKERGKVILLPRPLTAKLDILVTRIRV